MKKLTLICVYNNLDLVNAMVESCKKQTIDFNDIDFVLIDNSSSTFPSASSALNHGVKNAKTDKLIFLHQDIEFLQSDALEYIVEYLNENPLSLVGSAGVKSREIAKTGDIISSMYAGPDKTKYSDEKNPQEAFVLDECLFGCDKSLFDKISFDEHVCDSWHLYAADLCLQALTNGFTVVVLPLEQVWHKSNGNADKSYYRTQNALAKKWRKHFSVINTTNSYVYTNPFKRVLLNMYRALKYGKKCC